MVQVINFLILLLCITFPTTYGALTKRPKPIVDKEHYNKVYGSRLTARKDIDYLKPGGSPWPWYEQAKLQHADDKLLHKEQLREHKDYQAEYKKQFSENMRVYQETERVNLETQREGAILNSTDTKDGSNRKRRRKEEILVSEKESKQFLKR